MAIVGLETVEDTKKVKALDVPPPGEGLTTATAADPAETMSLAGIDAVKRVLSMKVVGRLKPFQVTVESEMNFEPVTARMKPGPATLTELGLSPVTIGTGLLILSVKVLVVADGVG